MTSIAGAGSRWSLTIVLIFYMLVFLPRSLLVSTEHGRTWDETFHLQNGLAVLTGHTEQLDPGDPLLGKALVALPLLALNATYGEPLTNSDIYDRRFSARMAQAVLYMWKVLLFAPAIAVLFLWCRQLYGVCAAALAIFLVGMDPTFAGHVPLPVLDALGAEGILIASWAWWRYAERPSVVTLTISAASTAIAMHIKHTAFVLPLIAVAIVALWRGREWLTLDRLEGRRLLRRELGASLFAVAAFTVSFWALTGFDVSPPGAWVLKLEQDTQKAAAARGEAVVPLRAAEKIRAAGLDRPWPAGWYIGTVIRALETKKYGHNAYLLGMHDTHGWWYYQPVVATYKVPIGFAVVGVLALSRCGASWRELSLLIPAIITGSFVMTSGVYIGFRHFLPCYQFLLAVASRSVRNAPLWLSVVAWASAVIGAAHGLSYHPDYISYINFPRHKVYLDISESNIDWGQSLVQLRDWVDARPPDGRPITLAYFGSDSVAAQLGDRVTLTTPSRPTPSTGIFVVSPYFVVGNNHWLNVESYSKLQTRTPIAVIGHNLLVFDMDRLE